ncbi:MAG TPA: helix-turn-helix transcriptional regulator [Thermoanaerobaculia bacterium]|jgi:transcriptional regulator with XRE-family HTH domain|nr:helix-turn-helix transcriptional regulator [Thermoanaerobaculia bacterium]
MGLTAERDAVRLAVVVLRYLEGRSQRQVEAISGVDQRRWSRYELGQVTPRRSTLERLARDVGVSPSRLDQLLAVLGQICEESRAHRVRTGPPADLEPSESDGREDLRKAALEVAAEIAESLEPLMLDSLADLEVPFKTQSLP